MKKIFALMLALLCVVPVVGCVPQNKEKSEIESVPQNKEKSEIESVSVSNIFKDANTVAYVSDEDAAVIANTVDGKWKKGLCDCVNDVRIRVDDETYRYSSTCGTFNDTDSGKSLVLSDDERKAFNRVLLKYISVGSDVVELFPGGNLNVEELDVTVSYANWTDYEKIYTDALNSDKIGADGIHHEPIYRFDTLKEMKAFKDKFGGVLTMNYGYNQHPSFNDATEKYDAEFFEKNSLILVYVTSNSGSLRYGVNGVFCDGKSFTVSVVQTNAPGMMTWDMAGWFITLAVSDSTIENCVEFDAIFSGIENAAEDFSFSLSWNTYGISFYDSISGRLIKTTDATRPEDYVTTYVMPEEELELIYEMICSIDIDSYPDGEYDPYDTPEGIEVASEPSSVYELTVRMGGTEKTVRVSDVIPSLSYLSEKGRQFFKVCKHISTFLMSTEEWQALPEYEHFYE